MGYVIIRHFRSGDGPTTSRVFPTEREARDTARQWASEGWEVDMVMKGGRGIERVRMDEPTTRPIRRNGG